MPTIPAYRPDSVDAIGVPGARIQSVASPQLFGGADNAGQAGNALSAGGEAWQKHALALQAKEDTALATEAEAGFLNKITDYKLEARKRQGLNANGLPEEADQVYADISKEILDSAPNERVKQALGVIITKHQPGFHGYIGAHAAEQLDIAADAGIDAQIAAQINAAAADPAEAATARGRIIASVSAKAANKGWDKDVTEAAILAKTTELHTSVINALMVHSPNKAVAYFATVKDDISGEQQTKIEGHLKATVDANDAIVGADEVWSKLGPKVDGQPVQLDIMEAEVRKMYAGDAAKIKETVAEVRSRATAFNSAETERAASRVNTVMEAYSNGATLAKIKAMPEYQSLPGEKKASIQQHIEAKAYQSELRSNARLTRQDLVQRREEAARQKRGYGAYLVYSNPEVLNRLTENQIIAMIPDIGEDKAGSLMTMKRKLSNPVTLTEAKMDTDDFNQIASKMGMNPFAPRQTEEQKAALGGLRFRIEHLIDAQQSQLKRPLTRNEKNQIMRAETARAVTVEGGWFSSDKEVPVIQLENNDVDRVVISAADRKTAAARLQTLHERFPNDPAYQPTERNLRRLHLQTISQAADFIDAD